MAELFVPKILDLLGETVVKTIGRRVNLVLGAEEEVANLSSKLATIERMLREWNFRIHRAENEETIQGARKMQPTILSKVRSFILSLCSCLKQVPIRSEIALRIKDINEKLESTLKEAGQFNFISNSEILDSQDFSRIVTTSIIDETEVYGQRLIQLIQETFSGKRFLLVLDDVWTEEDSKWKPFKNSLKNAAPGSVILVTTRSLRVARVMGTTHTHQMVLLSDPDCWQIMQSIAFAGRSEEWCKKVERIGYKIAEKCKGLPLAAKTMGSLLRFKDTVQQWQNVLDNEIWQLEKAAVELFPHLILSYNELSPELKRCFSYCAVFPKDHVINVEELIRMWIAQGYVRPNRRGERLEVMGHEYFNNLAMRSFFQELKTGDGWYNESMECRMHDIVHDFAQFLTKNECQVLDGIDGDQGTNKSASSQRNYHLTWLGTKGMLTSLVLDFGRLRSMILHGSILRPRGVVLQDLNRLKCVRTLTLRYCNLREVPSEIGSLIHLRYLDLSYNDFTALPEAIYDLYYLETLDINRCDRLGLLPERIEALVHLRHLLNSNYRLQFEIPQGLEKLTSLCSLSRLSIFKSDDLTKLKYLNQLERVGIMVHTEVDFRNAELGKKIYLHKFYLRFGLSVEFLETPCWIESMELPPNLQILSLRSYPGNQLPGWLMTKPLTNNLTMLFITRPLIISSFPTLWKLSSLELLCLEDVLTLEYLGKEFFGITEALRENSLHDAAEGVAFPNLRKLQFSSNYRWTNWEDLE